MENILEQAYKLQNNKQFSESTELFQKLLEDKKYYPVVIFEIAKNYKMSNNPIKAIDYFAELINYDQTNKEAIKELAQTACLSKKFDKAEPLLRELTEMTKETVCFIEYINLLFVKNDIKTAELYIQKALDLNIKNIEIKFLQAKLYRTQEYLTKAINIYNDILLKTDDKESVYIELAEIYFLQGQYEEAIKYFEKAVVKKNDKYLYLKLVELYYLVGKNDKSDKAGEKALELTPKNKFDQDVILNEIEILQRKTVLKSKMKRLWVTVTSKCNIKCKTCGLWSNPWDLPYKTAKEIINNYPYMERLVWLGGEVFLYKHFEEMFDEAGKWSNLKQQIITNGVALNKKWIEKIIKTENSELTFSIDGTTKEVYEEIRRGSNFERLLENVRYTMETKKKYGVKKDIRMNAVIMKTNYKQIYDLLEFAKKEGFNQLSYLTLHFAESPDENIFYGDTKDQEALNYVYKSIPILKNKAKEYNIELDVLLPCSDEGFDGIVSQTNEQVAENICETKIAEKGLEKTINAQPKDVIVPVNRVCCKMPWNYMMICDEGNVILTGSCVRSIGNIYDNSIDEIWNSTVAQEYRQRMIEKKFTEDSCRTECTGRW
ncbi:MAG: tetratricopeptide repeat protein [Endomicrobiaceae bacterium]|jgi:MoaA/NifB/PqqE/SkfB family radical SAM enzyme/Flp pilus assembly protein TadD|nr:tetratricopeptide repeat protein [Endomicrobiaceae bacterium]MDD3729417.1 tetratricopeptide repeat protein [Endomicrobiaceae bacterium]MDD4166390.1 tetratricopeptide repeat protein [Endomicrobiaceae bacterium]